jgi:CRP-like cAMP-binding protein
VASATTADLRFMDALAPEDAVWLRRLGGRRRHPTGTALFREREPGDCVLVVLSGRVKLVTLTRDGQEVVLGIREPGDLIGEMSALDGEDRTATAIALEPVEARAITVPDFMAFLESTPGAALALARLLSARLRDADRKRAEYAALDTLGRVAARLVELAERFGSPTRRRHRGRGSDHAGGPRWLDGLVPRGRDQGAAHAPGARADHDRPPLGDGARSRRAETPLRVRTITRRAGKTTR